MDPMVWNLDKASSNLFQIEFSKYWKVSPQVLETSSHVWVVSRKSFLVVMTVKLEQAACGGSAAPIRGGFQDQAKWSHELPDLTS